MRIHTIRLANFRGVDERTLELDAGVTVVVGPNEVGKSSVAEALQLLLEEKDSTSKQAVESVRPVHRDADPEVELVCTTGPYRLTYRKVFGGRSAARRSTELRVEAPRAENLTGDEAHERMLEILAETVDPELWAALRVEQRRDLGQADLAGSGALARALDAAAGSSAPDGDATVAGDGVAPSGAAVLADTTLVERVEEAAGHFWTGTFQPRRPLKDADDEVDRLAARESELAEALAEVEREVEAHDAAVEEASRAERALPELRLTAEQAGAAAAALADLEQAVTRSDGQLATAQERLASAEQASTHRRDAVRGLEGLREQLREHAEVLSAARTSVEQAEQAREQARQEAVEARRVAREAADATRRATADAEHLRRVEGLDGLRERVAAAAALAVRRGDARRVLDAEPPHATTLAELRELQADVGTTEALRDAGVPQLRLSATAASSIELDGVTTELDVGVDEQLLVDHERTVRVGDVTMTVTPGTSADDLAEAVTRAEDALAGALAAAGVASLGEAEERSAAGGQAHRVLEETDAAWTALQQDGGLDALRERLDAAETAIAEADAGRDRPLPDDLAGAERLADETRELAERAEERLGAAREGLDAAGEALGTAREHAAAAEARHDALSGQVSTADQQLAAARSERDDDTLDAAVAQAREALGSARDDADRARSELAAADPDAVRAAAAAATARLKATEDQLTDATARRERLGGALDARAADGLGEEHQQVQNALADARARRDAQWRRAEALRLLLETLRRHRDEARARYVAPLRAEVERLGRVVFGSDFAVELDEQLRIVTRTLAGRTLDVEQLSGGAQEQLGLLTRLAAAVVVDPVDGVPLLLDDALGYADAARVDRVNALLAQVGQRSQVIVLTCSGERFAGIPDARRITLP